ELAKPLDAKEPDPTAQEREKCIQASHVKKQALSAATLEVESKNLAATSAKNAVQVLKDDFDNQSISLTNAVKENIWEIVSTTVPLTDDDQQKLRQARLAVTEVQQSAADIERIYLQVNDLATTAGRIRAIV